MDASEVRDVDSKLVSLARHLRCPIMTNDYNLNRVAEIQGVTVLNINDLANAVKAIFLPGEELAVKIIQEGRESGQGVGYLEDGTMVVIEDGRKPQLNPQRHRHQSAANSRRPHDFCQTIVRGSGANMPLKIYNVFTRQKEEFVPLTKGKVNMYVCGPTVYDDSHIGHGKTYVGFDVVVRYLRFAGYDVLYVQNITDVGHMLDTGEDRILKKARQLSAGPMQVVETYTRHYFDDMDALGVQRPDISPRASGHIPEQIAMIEKLIEKGHAYDVDGSVYFDVSSYPEYGKLSGRIIEDLEEGTRVYYSRGKETSGRFCPMEKSRPGAYFALAQPLGRRLSRLACRMFGDGRQIFGPYIRYSRRRHRQHFPAQ